MAWEPHTVQPPGGSFIERASRTGFAPLPPVDRVANHASEFNDIGEKLSRSSETSATLLGVDSILSR